MIPLLAIAAATAAVKGAIGAGQFITGKAMGKAQRPQYDISQGADNAMNLAAMRATDPMMAGQKLMEQKVSGATSAGIGSARESSTDPASLLAATSAMVSGEQDALTNIQEQAAQNYDQRQSQLYSAYQNYGQEQDKKWDMNVYQPYQAKMQAAQQLKDAGAKNMMGAVDSIGSASMYSMGKTGGTGTTGATTGSTNSYTPLTPYTAPSVSEQADIPVINGATIPAATPFTPSSDPLAQFTNSSDPKVQMVMNMPAWTPEMKLSKLKEMGLISE